jgi:hypothetical protein
VIVFRFAAAAELRSSEKNRQCAICATLPRMATKKLSKSHTSADKKATASSRKKKTASSGMKKATATKARKSKPKANPPKPKKETPEQWKKRMELTLRAFRIAYEANQRGEFQRL